MRHMMILMLLVSWTVAAGAAERKFEKSFTVEPGGLLRVDLDAGSVEVKGTTGGAVKVVGVLEGDRDAIEEYRLDAQQGSDGVEVTGTMKKKLWKFWDWDQLDVRLTIEVPRSYNLRLRTAGGNLIVRGLDGRVIGTTSGGNIEGTEITGDITIETSGGNIVFDGVTGELTGETSGGNVSVRRVKGPVRVETSGGNITLAEIAGTVRAHTSGGDVRADIRENRGVDLHTSGGDILISLQADAGAMLDASSSGGSVTCDLPVTMQGKLDESRIAGTMNGGGEKIRARTSGGDITIRPLR